MIYSFVDAAVLREAADYHEWEIDCSTIMCVCASGDAPAMQQNERLCASGSMIDTSSLSSMSGP